MEVFVAAPPCPSVFEHAAAEVAAVCVGRGTAARSAAASAVARSPAVAPSRDPPSSHLHPRLTRTTATGSVYVGRGAAAGCAAPSPRHAMLDPPTPRLPGQDYPRIHHHAGYALPWPDPRAWGVDRRLGAPPRRLLHAVNRRLHACRRVVPDPSTSRPPPLGSGGGARRRAASRVVPDPPNAATTRRHARSPLSSPKK
ncbi:hypothetical protein DAI22_07g180500 [Oryza sativa Japonica Group]|nr:hypothetical protein DAI22_07g180500 [Oryza sativa Japonica Group]